MAIYTERSLKEKTISIGVQHGKGSGFAVIPYDKRSLARGAERMIRFVVRASRKR